MVNLIKTTQAFMHNEGIEAIYSDMPLRKRLWSYRYGFLSKSAELYDLDSQSVDRYISDYQLRKTDSINAPHQNLLAHKIAFHALLSHSHRNRLPTLMGRIDDGQLVTVPSAKPPVGSLESLINDYLDDCSLILKPVDESGGEGVFSISGTDTGYTLDGYTVGRDELLTRLRGLDDYIVTEHISQAGYAQEIYPRSTNTIRIVSMVDPYTEEPFICTAVHRFGTDDSAPVDNWSSGGICAAVDVETGVMTEAAAHPNSGQPIFLSKHPDTGSPIANETVPSWNSIYNIVLSIADEFSLFWKYVGWNVALTDHNGSIAIIEANSRTDVDLLQIHEPLLDDPRVRRFYEYHGVI